MSAAPCRPVQGSRVARPCRKALGRSGLPNRDAIAAVTWPLTPGTHRRRAIVATIRARLSGMNTRPAEPWLPDFCRLPMLFAAMLVAQGVVLAIWLAPTKLVGSL